ncbi:SDR family NAD(P)-dependent oxidoreductase [Candidatus Poriferisocius sp.]|uniref:SDR family NAD(P)-dependent oxidoreductase n=1 Tax=Candidatus Poriferisocius sp. TaxID=3101276 RepID=UPI003B5A1D73
MSELSTARPLAGKTALVTGGAGGIGRSTARLLVADGAHVLIASRNPGHLQQTADELTPLAAESGGSVDWAVCDATDSEQVRAAVVQASEPTGRIDMAVSVPGGGAMASVLDCEPEQFADVVNFNVMAPFLMIKHAGRAMADSVGGAESGGGSIVAVSSTAAVQSCRFLSAYCAGKAGVDALVRVAADELGAHGVRVNAVRPGLTATDATVGLVNNDNVVAQYLEQQPLQRIGHPDDIAWAIRYLAGPESSFTTGQFITVDGGHTLRSFVDFADVVASRSPAP